MQVTVSLSANDPFVHSFMQNPVSGSAHVNFLAPLNYTLKKHYFKQSLVSLSPKVPEGQSYTHVFETLCPYKDGKNGHCLTHVLVLLSEYVITS